MKRIVGYCDPLSVEPGQQVRFMVSSSDGDFEATVVRLWCGDVSPDGHGFDEEVVPTGVDGRYPGRAQAIRPGSFALVETSDALARFERLRVDLAVWPTAPGGRNQTLLSCHTAGGRLELSIDESGRPTAHVGDDGIVRHLVCPSALPRRRWTRLRLLLDHVAGTARLIRHTVPNGPGERTIDDEASCSIGTGTGVGLHGPIVFAATMHGDGTTSHHFDGRLDACSVADTVDGPPVVAWDFGAGIGTDLVHDVGPLGLHGRTVQLPTRAVPGIGWTGDVHDWRTNPAHYGAIHFHSDDLSDAGWEQSVVFDVPADFPSGVYALRTTTANGEDHIPFFVTPTGQGAAAPVAFLAPTVTYRAYANIKLTATTDRVFGNWTRHEMDNERYLLEHPEIGLGHYDHHLDGSGVVHSSHLRPIMNLRPKCGLWSFTADTNVVAWLRHTGLDHDVVTDDLVHDRGAEVLRRHRVIVTGTHPEYWTTPMLDALEQFLASGGRLVYLGANGFYWRASFHPAAPASVEVRRAEDGTRAWIAEPGEYHHESTGELGGLWRRIGRPPNRVAGVGFAAQGFSSSGSYRWTDAARDERVSFAVDGCREGDVLGDHGSVGGGAAGQEIDRYDATLGSPAHAVVLATSHDLPSDMLLTKEELFANGIAAAPVRSDVVFFETPSGGAVFSASSIAWAASLASNGYDNAIARLTTNVLRRFADPEPFTMP